MLGGLAFVFVWLVVLVLLGVEFAFYTEGSVPNGSGHGGH